MSPNATMHQSDGSIATLWADLVHTYDPHKVEFCGTVLV
jgi:hypothetical protein